jgi:tagatose-6-phosphate ketose/aldose isomerase
MLSFGIDSRTDRLLMNDLLLRTGDMWRQHGGLNTAKEIHQQPAIWRALAADLRTQQQRIQSFIGDWLAHSNHRVILTGAGSSAYIGEIIGDDLDAAWPAQVRAIPSTSLLTHPRLYLDRDRPTLLVSFARSGHSPESLAALELVHQSVGTSRFLNITCNAGGELARRSENRADTLNLLMPEGSCDHGFAMTSSFTAMLLAAQAVLGRAPWSERLQHIEQLAQHAEIALREWEEQIAALAREPFERIVFLGSGPLEALAKEAALKVLELTSGRVLAIANTSLGFRHGPKSVLNKSSLVVVFRSGESVARRYEQDLLHELHREHTAASVLTVGSNQDGGTERCFTVPPLALPDCWLAPLWLLMAQQFALHKSAALGLTPDDPFPDGTLNRVVRGVTIHAHAAP